jgi:Flp pilus assembly protein TadG
MMWALMGAVLVGLVGVTVDFTRAQMVRTQIQNAADGAALVAERSSNLSMSERTAAARAYFDSEVGDLANQVTFTVSQMPTGGHRVEVTAPLQTSLARLVNNSDWTVKVASEAQANASPPIEVALVLDNTGSMSNDMDALRDAASDLAADLLALDGDTVRVALVPFVAQVNIGNEASHLAWMDTTGAAAYNGELLEDRAIAYRTQSNSTTGANCEKLSTLPFTGYTGPYRITWRRGDASALSSLLGASGGLNTRCYAWTQESGIDHLTLFNLISNEDWKGCVEARPEPYDVNDAAPTPSAPDSMFVPFFWLDTVDGVSGLSSSNSYIADSQGAITGATMSSRMTNGTNQPLDLAESRMFNVFKYRNNTASLDTSAPDTRGPNRGCPTPIVPLTSNETTIQNNIAAMRHWSGGGTNQAEGLAWGWRVLSPTAPFTEGVAFNGSRNNVRKVIVLMSDGENTNVGDDPVLLSDYSAYNHLGTWTTLASGGLLGQLINGIVRGILPTQYRRAITSSNSYVSYVNGRQAALCNNIKNAGIEIYVVRFRDGDASVMRNCATQDGEHYFEADNATELADAFDAIGSGIGALRLTR